MVGDRGPRRATPGSTYRVAAGLDGNAKAVTDSGGAPRGTFSGTVSDEAPEVQVSDDGKTVVEGTR